MRKTTLAATLTVLVVTAGCGGGSSSDPATVKLTPADTAKGKEFWMKQTPARKAILARYCVQQLDAALSGTPDQERLTLVTPADVTLGVETYLGTAAGEKGSIRAGCEAKWQEYIPTLGMTLDQGEEPTYGDSLTGFLLTIPGSRPVKLTGTVTPAASALTVQRSSFTDKRQGDLWYQRRSIAVAPDGTFSVTVRRSPGDETDVRLVVRNPVLGAKSYLVAISP